MTERTIRAYGVRGNRVRVYRLTTTGGTHLVRAEWREGGQRQRVSWPDTPDNRKTAKAYADGTHRRLLAGGAACAAGFAEWRA